MLKAGSIILTVWGGFNFLLAASILVAVAVFQKTAPILFIVFDEAEIPRLEAKVLATSKALAILFNSCAAALSLTTLFVVWGALAKGQRWAFWAVLLSVGLTQVMGFVADNAIGMKTLIPNLVLTVLFVVGIGLSGLAIFRS
jgi:hypothetical protein